MPESSDDNFMTEWTETRNVLRVFDDRIHDLRKYGFTFVTGILTAQGILLPYVPATATAEPSGIPDEAKLGVLVATTLLIIVLRWFDGNYQGFQYGASMRAKVLERFHNLELSDTISLRYRVDKLWVPKIILYAGFEGAVIGLAYALLPEHSSWVAYLTIGIVVENILYYRFASPERLRGKFAGTDWALDRLRCTNGETVRIMLTNLGSTDRILEKDTIAWKILDKNNVEIHSETVHNTIKVTPSFSYVWAWNVGDKDPGIYRIKVNIDDNEERELSRKLYVVGPDSTAASSVK